MDKRALLLAPLLAWIACGGSKSGSLFGTQSNSGGGGGDDSVGSGPTQTTSGGPVTSASSGGGSHPTTTGTTTSGGGLGGGTTSSSGMGGAGGTGNTSANTSSTTNSATNSSVATTAASTTASTTGAGGSGGAIDPTLIDDMEDGDQRIINVSGRTGYWYSENDGTGVQDPGPLSTFLPTSIVPPRGNSLKAMHVTGAGFSMAASAWGAVTKVDFNNLVSGLAGNVGAPQPYNASGYQGVAFYAKGTNLRFELRQRDITLVAEGGTCSVMCSDFYGTPVVLSPTWTLYALPFSSFAQRNFGVAVPFTPADIFGAQFVTTGPTFDFWIDDIRFY